MTAVTPALSEDDAIEAVAAVLREHMHSGRVWYATAKVLDALDWPKASPTTVALLDCGHYAVRSPASGVRSDLCFQHGDENPWHNIVHLADVRASEARVDPAIASEQSS